MDDIETSTKEKVISCFGNISSMADIARLCGCSPAYVTTLKGEFEDFMDTKVAKKGKRVRIKGIHSSYYKVFSRI